ncbi:hypothetical protein HPB50_015111 [Hyalomma asiaticum]|uniref:Uncharacterized protein n=1 Tax=Hyalomma asiaticum TaxID=266040 RepID=A0ACB7T1Z0_HYAAI|nr:hypothetical protein HPB50_015111 [Hyalomma asiaticum]
MVAWPPPSLLCTVAVLLRVGIVAAAGIMSRRGALQKSAGSSPASPSAATRHHQRREDVVDDSAADPAMLLPELVGHLLNEAAARVDDQAQAIRLDDGVVWKPLRDSDQVKAAGEHVSALTELKNEPRPFDDAAAAVENDVYASPEFRSSEVRSGVVQQAAEREAQSADAATLAPEDRRVQKVAVDMAQNHPSGGSGKDAANRAGTPSNRKVVPKEPKDDSKDLAASRAKEERRDVAGGGPLEVGSKWTMTETLDVMDAGVQAATAEVFSGGQTEATAESSPRKRVVTADREVQTVAESSKKKSPTKDRHSQTLPTTPTLYSMATQTDVPEAPWYMFHTSVQKKKLAVVISAVFVLIYFILCYGLVSLAREFYAEHMFEELDFL